MLVNGRFIKEEPPQIGVFYIPRYREEDDTPEERFMQDLILGNKDMRMSFFSRFLGLMLRV